MEKYVIDLDKVLDELELNDDNDDSNNLDRFKDINDTPSSLSKNSQLNNNTKFQNYYSFRASNESTNLSAYEKFDIKEADFSIQSKPPKILNSISNLDTTNLNLINPNLNRCFVNSLSSPSDSNHDALNEASSNINYIKNELLESKNFDKLLTESVSCDFDRTSQNLNHLLFSSQVTSNNDDDDDDESEKSIEVPVKSNATSNELSICSDSETDAANNNSNSITVIDDKTSIEEETNGIILNSTDLMNNSLNNVHSSLPKKTILLNINNDLSENSNQQSNTNGANDSIEDDIAIIDSDIEARCIPCDTMTISDDSISQSVAESNDVRQQQIEIEHSGTELSVVDTPNIMCNIDSSDNNRDHHAETENDNDISSVTENDNTEINLNEQVTEITTCNPNEHNGEVHKSEEETANLIYTAEQHSVVDLDVHMECLVSVPMPESLLTNSEVDDANQDHIEKFTPMDISQMSEAELDNYLQDLNEPEPIVICADDGEDCDLARTDTNETVDNASCDNHNYDEFVEEVQSQNIEPTQNNDSESQQTIASNNSLLIESFIQQNERQDDEESSKLDDTGSLSSNATLVINEDTPDLSPVSESATNQELEQSSSSLAEQEPDTSISNTEQTELPSNTDIPNSDNRGGLVQNIAYFERQEMPNGLTEEEQMLGKVKPFWIPDDEAQNCLHCDVKFTMIKRRHHCRSCGKVLCGLCCNFKAKLMYLENKEARVCQLCYMILMRIEEIERINGHPIDISQMEQTPDPSAGNSSLTISFPDPNNPAEYCSTVSPLEQVSQVSTMPPPTVMVPVGVLKRPGTTREYRRGAGDSSDSLQPGERVNSESIKQVMFSDGVRPGGDLVESPSTSRQLEERPISRSQLQLKSPPIEKPLPPIEHSSKRIKPSRVVVVDSNGTNLPPIVNYNELKSIDHSLPSKPTYSHLIQCLRNQLMPWITFGITKNLFVNAKLISKLCCNSVESWSFASRGLATVGQDEVLLAIDCFSLTTRPAVSDDSNKSTLDSTEVNHNPSDEPEFPRDILRFYTTIYDSASKASLYTELSHIFFPDGLFGNKENSGFIFIRPTLQCFQNVLVPSPPFLIAILIHKWEIPWAKVFPLRLVLRLGYEYKMYPAPVISFANRKPVYFEIGHTIMNVLADFRNFQYTLSIVKDLVIHVEERKRVSLLIPKLNYEKACKVLSTSNEHVLAFGGNFSLKADSHFVCIQNEEDDDVHGQYQTQLNHLPISAQKITGASFIVFSGALKSSTGLRAKMNLVEDGLLIQIPPNTMEELRVAIRDMKDFKIDCCKVSDTEVPDEWVQINWVNEELSTNLGVRSQIDGLNLEGVQSARIFSSPDYTNDRYLIRWIEVFLLQINENSPRSEMLNTSRLAEAISQAFCVALIDYLGQLYDSGLTKISLRISLDVDKVGYEAGSNSQPLPSQFSGQLDGALIPAIMENISTSSIEDPLVIELLFYILLK